MKLSPLKKSLFTLILISGLYLMVEILIGTFYLIRNKNFVSPQMLLAKSLGQNWQSTLPANCEYKNILGPHPYLSYVMFGQVKKECLVVGHGLINNKFMSGPNYPERKNPDEFVIMLTGGSVADQLGTAYTQKQTHYLTEYFNTHFIPPRGKTFRIIVSALGDYRFPQNLIGPMLHHQILDGIIDLSGYNESHQYRGPTRLETPSPNYWLQYELEHEKSQKNSLINNKVLLKKANESWCRYSYLCFFSLEKYLHYQVLNQKKEYTRYKVQEQLFAYPKSWSLENAWKDRIKQHQGYYKIMTSMCQRFDLYCSFFLQPIPQIGKELTDEEQVQIQNETPNFKDVYSKMTSDLLTIKKEGVPLFSLLNVFNRNKEKIYSDHVHYFNKPNENVSQGNKIVTKAIGNVLQQEWKLQRKK